MSDNLFKNKVTYKLFTYNPHIYIYIYIYICIYIYVCVYMCVHVCVCVCAFVYNGIWY